MNLYLIKDNYLNEKYIVANNIMKAIDIFTGIMSGDKIIEIKLLDENIIMENN